MLKDDTLATLMFHWIGLTAKTPQGRAREAALIAADTWDDPERTARIQRLIFERVK